MVFATLDITVRRTLLERGLPIHWYSEILFHQSAALRELSKDTLSIVNTTRIPIDSIGAGDLPDDFDDDIAVCFNSGGLLYQIPHNDKINPLRFHNATTGAFEPQSIPNDDVYNTTLLFGGLGWGWTWNINEFGESLGRQFGNNGGTGKGYKIVKERRQIQLTSEFQDGAIVLQYISNGQHIDNATQIDWKAFAAIQAYSAWKSSVNRDNIYSPEAMMYYNEKRLLRANLNELNIADIKNIIRSGYTATIKN